MRPKIISISLLAILSIFRTIPCYSSIIPVEEIRHVDNIVKFNIKYHFVRKSDGTGQKTFNTAANTQKLNNAFNQHGIYFINCIEDGYINNSSFYSGNSLISSSDSYANSTNAIDIFIFNTGPTNAQATRAGRIFLRYIDDSNPSLIVHEMGHVFNLVHTFDSFLFYKDSNGKMWRYATIPSDEFVTRVNKPTHNKNCDTAGDGLCDTPADRDMNVANAGNSGEVDSNCIYTRTTGFLTDAYGDYYDPDTRNFMSYSNSSCRDSFTAGQVTRMWSWINDPIDRWIFISNNQIVYDETSFDYTTELNSWKTTSSTQPSKPVISGPTSIPNGSNYYFNASSSQSPSLWDWQVNYTFGTLTYYESGSQISLRNTVTNSNTYFANIKVRAYNQCGWSAWSNPKSISLTGGNGGGPFPELIVNNGASDKNLVAYPSTADNHIYLTQDPSLLKEQGFESITISDHTGRVILTSRIDELRTNSIDLSYFDNGQYFIVIHGKEIVYKSSFIRK